MFGHREQGFHRCEVAVADELVEVARVLTVGRNEEAVVAATQNANAAFLQLFESLCRPRQFLTETELQDLRLGEPLLPCIRRRRREADVGTHEHPVLVCCEQIDRFLVGEVGEDPESPPC